MLFFKKTIALIIVSFLLCALIGCNESNKAKELISDSELFASSEETLKTESNPAKYEQSTQKNTIIDSTIELTQKYAKLSEECSILKEKNKNLTNENQNFKEKTASLQTQLDQTKKELSEANDLLVEMRIELNNWKVDILGFRDEMRDAQKAQLEALFKILTILGGQTNTNAAGNN